MFVHKLTNFHLFYLFNCVVFVMHEKLHTPKPKNNFCDNNKSTTLKKKIIIYYNAQWLSFSTIFIFLYCMLLKCIHFGMYTSIYVERKKYAKSTPNLFSDLMYVKNFRFFVYFLPVWRWDILQPTRQQ